MGIRVSAIARCEEQTRRIIFRQPKLHGWLVRQSGAHQTLVVAIVETLLALSLEHLELAAFGLYMLAGRVSSKDG